MRKLSRIAWTLGLILAMSPMTARAISLDFVLPPGSIFIGNTATVDVVISGLGNLAAPSLSTFDIDLLFNSSVLGVNTTDANMDGIMDRVTLDPTGQLDVLGIGGNPVSAGVTAPGTLNLFELSLDSITDFDSMQAGSFTLARITFDASALGTSPLTLLMNSLGDANGDPLPATLGTGSLTVSPQQPGQVPEPCTWLLLATGSAGLLMYGRRRWQ
jgi:hypothetical protein